MSLVQWAQGLRAREDVRGCHKYRPRANRIEPSEGKKPASPTLRPVCSSLWKLPLFLAYLFFFSWFLFFLIFYTGVLVSAIQQHESAIITHIPPLSGSSLPCPQPAIWVIKEGQTELALPCFPSAVRFAHSTVYMLMTRSPFVPLFPSS